ncbi:ATP-dependent nuclease [Haloarchaeobius sp. TZWSO28]|uniref:ATP-dependent nuclease n=1 Tax=Haloarchaeobius sp. TZWSO28 TaxID=3446119 RepID=UPI003EBBC1D6
MRIESFTTKNNETVELGDFTVLVGPNNTGKSQTLLDIHSIMASNQPQENTQTTIVEEIEYQPQPFSEFISDLTISPHPNSADRRRVRGINPNLRGVANQDFQEQQLERLEETEDVTDHQHFRHLSQFKVALLDASSRLTIAESTDTYNLSDGHPTNILQKLYTAPRARERLREAFQDTFGKDILLDFSSLREFILRIDNDFGENENHLLEPPEDYSEYKSIDDQGAGFKSFAGVVLSLLLTEDRVVLLDEPEAFLHPAQARQFGSWMANHATEIPGQLIIATHNSHFLTGILTASEGIAIHRLNRADDYTKYNTMPRVATSELASDPLLSNQRVIEGVFHRGVVVCEADGDALIYRFASEEELDERDFLFTHAHNKQTINRVTKILTDASIPRAAVVDIDILKDPGEYGELLRSLDGGEQDFQEITNTCNHFNQSLRSSDSDWDEIKKHGKESVPETAEEEFQQLYEVGRNNGLFIVDVGELEGWLNLEASKGPRWVIEALDTIDEGNCGDQLKEFVVEIRDYLSQQYRELVVAEPE